jgi:hypothetical protein
MTVRKSARMEFRVSDEDRCFLEERLRERGQTLSDWVRQGINDERERALQREGRAALDRLFAMNIQWIPDNPADLDSLLNDQDSPVDDSWPHS